ncbi:hypothetical protein [Massilia sp. S19_KUP03_FR1]|uniref:hypothetical protein n=1 Tax=Massilia sp. S19_KUP03_FR1 TaxID=3025503 RepID=UPI002FCDCE31
MILLIALIGAASMLAYAWRRRWLDAVLALVATGALAGLAADVHMPSLAPKTVETIAGDGLRASQWDDLPARPMAWVAPTTDTLRLVFPRALALGRMFTLTVQRSNPAPARLQLLAENGQVLADTAGSGDLTVQWLPPVAEKLVLQARLLDQAGKLIDQGPVPVIVQDNVPLQVRGRFNAPSFDVRALEAQLVASHAAIDWQVTLGKAVTRSAVATKEFAADLEIVDAAWFEQAAPASRAALLARVAAGTPLLILAGNANNAGAWSQALQLALLAQPEGQMSAGPMTLAAPPFNPASANAGPWRSDDSIVWTRTWQQGRITWLGAADWHKYAITQPHQLAAWWQSVIDRAGVQRAQDVTWLEPDEMPLPGQRLAVCAQGVKGDITFPQLGQTLALQQRADHIDAACVAVWPRQAGWLTVGAAHALYVHDPKDWPLWQRAQRRDATRRYLARTPGKDSATAPASAPFATMFALLFGLALLLLWWRERR